MLSDCYKPCSVESQEQAQEKWGPFSNQDSGIFRDWGQGIATMSQSLGTTIRPTDNYFMELSFVSFSV